MIGLSEPKGRFIMKPCDHAKADIVRKFLGKTAKNYPVNWIAENIVQHQGNKDHLWDDIWIKEIQIQCKIWDESGPWFQNQSVERIT